MAGSSLLAAPSRFLIVTLGGRYLAFDAESIAGVCTLEEAGCRDDPTMLGLVYRTVKLADRLRISNDQDAANTRIVLLAEQGVRGSIRVTAVQGMLDLHPSQVLPLPPHFRGPERRWYQGMILFKNSIVLALNTMWVLDEQESSAEGSRGQDTISRLVATPKISVNDRRVC
ncbi:MAG: hypothetical protein HP496_15310 [Nitrospira sp.]|nr:hypothetical protein [Nitrospira sp.]